MIVTLTDVLCVHASSPYDIEQKVFGRMHQMCYVHSSRQTQAPNFDWNGF